MQNNNYIDTIIHGPVTLFDEIIEKLVARNIYTATIEMEREKIEVDSNLLESINTILAYLKEEEGAISCFLYAHFGYEFQKSKRREQLNYFGARLAEQHTKIKFRCDALERQTERVSSSIVELEKLRDQLSEQGMVLEGELLKRRLKEYVERTELKLGELDSLRLSLQIEYEANSAIEEQYHTLLKRIPRYKKLGESPQLLIGTTTKK